MKSVMIIEDDDLLRENLVEMLAMEGYTVQQADDGKTAIDLILQNSPDIIFCDVDIPVKDGNTLFNFVKFDPNLSNIPFYFMTGYRDKIEHTTDYQPDGVIFKPFKPVEFLDICAQL